MCLGDDIVTAALGSYPVRPGIEDIVASGSAAALDRVPKGKVVAFPAGIKKPPAFILAVLDGSHESASKQAQYLTLLSIREIPGLLFWRSSFSYVG